MKIYTYKNNFFKESIEVRDAILWAVNNLYDRIATYEKQNITFAQIFNDDRVKYDKHGNFYTFKFKKSNMQIRILYAYIMVDDTPVFVIADYFVKKRDSKKYIKQFDIAKDWDPYDVYNHSKFVMDVERA